LTETVDDAGDSTWPDVESKGSGCLSLTICKAPLDFLPDTLVCQTRVIAPTFLVCLGVNLTARNTHEKKCTNEKDEDELVLLHCVAGVNEQPKSLKHIVGDQPCFKQPQPKKTCFKQ
jgi:hypothetical protein